MEVIMPETILTRIAAKFQVTVPIPIREIFDLREGDLFQWEFNAAEGKLYLVPKRAQMLTPLTEQAIGKARERWKKAAAQSEVAEAAIAEKKIAAHAR
jgi:bifunctional DNA-binding transcriptional regulator/antitoxin component of YhaV-PrlF toxin-antitoxin module